MTSFRSITFICFILFFCSYRDKNISITYSFKQTDTSYSVNQCKRCVINFLQWYSYNQKRISAIPLINNNGSTDSTKFYSVNFPGTEKYLRELKKSGSISDVYINSWRNYFNKCDSAFKINPQNDGPPEGFDYDFVMQTQDLDDAFSHINKLKILSQRISGPHIKIILNNSLSYTLTDYKNIWLIDAIEPTQ